MVWREREDIGQFQTEGNDTEGVKIRLARKCFVPTRLFLRTCSVPDLFDDLFAIPAPTPPTEIAPAKTEPRIFSVAEVTRAVRGVLEAAFEEVWVEGEVSNFRQQASGHQYFTLKDADSQLACVQFARGSWRKAVQLSDGMLVQAKGRLTVYEARGQYQLVVSLVQAAGAGALLAKFEALKRRLAAEGLFDAERKRELPKFPRTLGIVTSPTGAALRDMLNVLARRAPWLRVIVSPARVQGDGAAAEIIAALDDLNTLAARGIAPVDLIVLARGGGSIEDLWEFNDERLARAIAASPLPVVSAVGHEIDFTIADFVADLRAPTPSAAAELVVPDTAELLRMLEQRDTFLRRHVLAALESAKTQLAGLARSALFREPAQRVEQAIQRVDSAEQALARAAQAQLATLKQRADSLTASLRQHRPDQRLALLRQHLATFSTQIKERFARQIATRRERLTRTVDVLRLLSPKHTLKRGYSVTTNTDGKLLRSAKDIIEGTLLITELRDGKVTSVVINSVPDKKVKPKKPPA